MLTKNPDPIYPGGIHFYGPGRFTATPQVGSPIIACIQNHRACFRQEGISRSKIHHRNKRFVNINPKQFTLGRASDTDLVDIQGARKICFHWFHNKQHAVKVESKFFPGHV